MLLRCDTGPPISTNDRLIAPRLLVSEEDVFAQQRVLKTIPSGLIHAVAQVRGSFLSGDVNDNEVLHMTPRKNGLDLLVRRFDRDGLPARRWMGEVYQIGRASCRERV